MICATSIVLDDKCGWEAQSQHDTAVTKAIISSRPQLLVLCLKYGAERTAQALMAREELGLKMVVWMRGDALSDDNARHCKALLKIMKKVHDLNAVKLLLKQREEQRGIKAGVLGESMHLPEIANTQHMGDIEVGYTEFERNPTNLASKTPRKWRLR